MAKDDRKLTDFEQLEALLYRIIRKLNTIEIGVDDAAHGYYKEKKRTSGLLSKIKNLREELGIEEPERKYPRVNAPNYAPGQPIMSTFKPEKVSGPMKEDVLFDPNLITEEIAAEIDDPEEILKRKDEGQ